MLIDVLPSMSAETKSKKKPEHSVKLPYLYKEGSKILKAYSEKKGSLKSLVYATRCEKLWRRLLAVVSLAADHATEVDAALETAGVLSAEPGLDPATARLLTAELLFGSGRLGSQARPVLTILRHAPALRAAAAGGQTPPTARPTTQLPRYVRINTLLAQESDVIQQLTEEGYQLTEYPADIDYDDFLDRVKALSGYQFLRDLHVPSLLVFPASTEFHAHPLYKNGQLILQDKASCLPATVLAPRPGEQVLDACAAPGMKTSQLAALMRNTGTLVAVERDKVRFQTLASMTRRAGTTNTRLLRADFLKLKPEHYSDVTAILLDPSCSGTGMVGRERESVPPERLHRLANLQGMLLRHALSFPSVKRVVYSTCSVTEEENEQVVAATLQTHPDWRLGNARPASWRSGGRNWLKGGDRCVRASSEGDLCHGFFVSLFVRNEAETTETMKTGGNEVGDAETARKTKRKRKGSRLDSNMARPSGEESDRPDNDRNHCETVILSEEGEGDLAEPRKKKHRGRKAGVTGTYDPPPASSEPLSAAARGNETACPTVRKNKKLQAPNSVLTERSSDGEVKKRAMKLVKDKKRSKPGRKSGELNTRGPV